MIEHLVVHTRSWALSTAQSVYLNKWNKYDIHRQMQTKHKINYGNIGITSCQLFIINHFQVLLETLTQIQDLSSCCLFDELTQRWSLSKKAIRHVCPSVCVTGTELLCENSGEFILLQFRFLLYKQFFKMGVGGKESSQGLRILSL